MKSELKARWIAALRSGEFQQGYGALRSRSGHCCLGVLCEVASIEIDKNGGATIVGGKPDGYRALTNLGIDEEQQKQLYRRNDDRHHSFAQIADYIEANIPSDNSVASVSSSRDGSLCESSLNNSKSESRS